MRSGVEVLVVLRAYVVPFASNDVPLGSGAPVALATQTCKVQFDISNDVYALDIHATAVAPRVLRVGSDEAVLRACFDATALGIVDRHNLSAGTFYGLAVAVDIIDPKSAIVPTLARRATARPAFRGIAPTDPLYVTLTTIQSPLAGSTPGSDLSTGQASPVRFITQAFVP